MEIIVNGQQESIPPCTVADLVTRKGLTPGMLVVELNRQIVKQGQWQAIELKAGDSLELLNFVGGG